MKITRGFKFIPRPKQIVKSIFDTKDDAIESVVEKVQKTVDPVAKKVTETVSSKTTRSINSLEQRRRIGVLVTSGRRFFRINGIDLAGLLSLEFFTTLIPILILGAGGLSGFNKNFNLGDSLVTRFGLNGREAQALHDTFPSGADLKSFYTFLGLLSFLIWGIPLAIQVGRIFASAYDSERFSLGSEIFRGTIWFILLLLNLSALSLVATDASLTLRILDFVLRFIAVYIFWVFTPALLVKDGVVGIKFLMIVGLAGAIMDSIVLPILFRAVIPLLVHSWDGFGSIGIAMTIATWCTVMSTVWVLVACFGGELAQRKSTDNIPANAK